jgi:hypothetical protein
MKCPFVNLPNAMKKSHWGEGITAEDMTDFRWFKPKLVARSRNGHGTTICGIPSLSLCARTKIRKTSCGNTSPQREIAVWPYGQLFCEDGTGQHAVEISIPLNGKFWKHVLIYDKTNRRVKTVKYSSGRYMS